MIRFSFLSLLFFLFSLSSSACLNNYLSVDAHGKLNEVNNWERMFDLNFNQKKLEKKILALEQKIIKSGDFQLASDYAVLLLKAGKNENALLLLESLFKQHPKEYRIVSNLGTAYELNGKLEQALKFIRLGIKLNPDSHYGSEWVHERILLAKIKLQKDPNYLHSNSILGLTELEKQDSLIRKQILIQVQERFPFSPGPNAVMADLLLDLADCYANSNSIEFAKAFYSISKFIFGAEDSIVDPKISLMVGLRNKYHSVKPEKETKGVYENHVIGGIRYREFLSDHINSNYIIANSRLNLDVDEILALCQQKPSIISEEKIDVEIPLIEEEEPVKKIKNGQGSYWTIVLIIIGFIAILWISLRKKRK